MAKGDYVKVSLATATGPIETGITITTGGRKLQTKTATKAKVQYVEIVEVNQHGRPTGDRLSVRQEAILSMLIHEEPVRAKAGS